MPSNTFNADRPNANAFGPALRARSAGGLNRAALILRYKQPFVDWINAADPNPTDRIELADANDDNTAYLVEAEDKDELEEWLKANGQILFEEELNNWYTDPDLWPPDGSLTLLREWCSLELHPGD